MMTRPSEMTSSSCRTSASYLKWRHIGGSGPSENGSALVLWILYYGAFHIAQQDSSDLIHQDQQAQSYWPSSQHQHPSQPPNQCTIRSAIPLLPSSQGHLIQLTDSDSNSIQTFKSEAGLQSSYRQWSDNCTCTNCGWSLLMIEMDPESMTCREGPPMPVVYAKRQVMLVLFVPLP